MTNIQIIAMEQERLAKEGVLKYTGRILKAELPDGAVIEVPEIEEIHTFAKWKALGFSVKKGEHAIAKFPIWKQGKGKTEKDDNGEEVAKAGRMFLKQSFFFTRAQVEAVKEK